jgi:hypothetical protein
LRHRRVFGRSAPELRATVALSDGFDAPSDDQAAKKDDMGAGYRENADECLRAANQTTDRIKKANWIKFAEESLWLAYIADHFSTERQADEEGPSTRPR